MTPDELHAYLHLHEPAISEMETEPYLSASDTQPLDVEAIYRAAQDATPMLTITEVNAHLATEIELLGMWRAFVERVKRLWA